MEDAEFKCQQSALNKIPKFGLRTEPDRKLPKTDDDMFELGGVINK